MQYLYGCGRMPVESRIYEKFLTWSRGLALPFR
jgi:hypothetical protein